MDLKDVVLKRLCTTNIFFKKKENRKWRSPDGTEVSEVSDFITIRETETAKHVK